MAAKHPHLTEEELAEFREIFNLVDLDKGGTISKDELKQLMTTLGLRPSQEELNAMVDEIDSDGNGEIDFDEFVTVMSRKVNTSYTPAQVKSAFKVFERDAPSGMVTMAALEQALTTYGSEKLSLSDAQELLSQIEPDENGLINYVEFVNMSALCATVTTALLLRCPPAHAHPLFASRRSDIELTVDQSEWVHVALELAPGASDCESRFAGAAIDRQHRTPHSGGRCVVLYYRVALKLFTIHVAMQM